MRALSIIGVSGAGKTSLIERLISRLSARGLKVGAVKHSHHRNVEWDRPGKDSQRFADAGAEAVALVAPDRMFVSQPLRREPSFEELCALMPEVDLLLVESWKALRLPCLEVIGDSGERVDSAQMSERLAIVSDLELAEDGGPRFARDDVDEIADWIVGWFG